MTGQSSEHGVASGRDPREAPSHIVQPTKYRIMRPQNASSAYRKGQESGAYLISQKERREDWTRKVGGRCKELVDDQAGFMADMTSIHFSMGRVEGSEDSSACNGDEQAG